MGASTYQAVRTATDYDTDGRAHFDRYDGSDDSRTSATGAGSTTAWFDCRIVTVLGGAGTTRVHWSDAGTNTGIEIGLDTNNKAYVSLGNGAARIAAVSANACALGSTYLLTRWYDGANGYVQVNDEVPVASAAVTLSAGTAGFTVGKTNGAASNFFNGRMYGAVGIKNYSPPASQREQIKRELARQARFVIP